MNKTKRNRSPTLAFIVSTPKYSKEDESDDDDVVTEISYFDGIFNKYINLNGITYRYRPLRSKLQFVLESLKETFGIRAPKCNLLQVGSKQLLTYGVYRDNIDGKILEEVPFSMFPREKWTPKFVDQLKSIYYFRYLFGLRTTATSLRVGFDGSDFFPISYMESSQNKGDLHSGPKYQITHIAPDDDKNTKLQVDPIVELGKILKAKTNNIRSKDVISFLSTLRQLLLDIDPSYSWLINSLHIRINPYVNL
jgi:hypothetical protein